MMQRAVIAIGVKKTGGLPELQAAVSSAAAVAAWAREHQGIKHVHLITDAKSKVTRDRIFEAVEKITNLGFIEQLIVYFSGHGINVGHEERWLLSKAPADPAAAVNVRGSELNARFCGVGHVVFVSDACRTAADSIQAQNVTGSEIFPNATPSGPERPVDQFYATLVGHPALEVKSVQDAAGAYRAAYSEVMLTALRGTVADVIDTDPIGRVVRPWPLKKHLIDAVPEFLHRLNVASAITQQPDARIESEPTAWLSLCPPVPAAAEAAANTAKRRRVAARKPAVLGLDEDVILPSTAMELDARGPHGLAFDAHEALSRVLYAGEPGKNRRNARRAARRGAAETGERFSIRDAAGQAALGFGPDHLETQCGIKVRGSRIAEAVAKHAEVSLGARGDIVQVSTLAHRPAANVVVRLDDGSAVLVPVFAGSLTSLSFDRDGLLEDVACEPSANTDAGREYARTAGDARRLRAVVAGASALGVFRLEDVQDAERLMDRIVAQAAPDAGMAVLAAYALHDRRMRDQIRTLDRHLAAKLAARIFDVALLTFNVKGVFPMTGGSPVYPCVPMLTQGWSLLSPLGVRLHGRLGELRASLRPSLWTHFTADAAGLLIDTIRSGKAG